MEEYEELSPGFKKSLIEKIGELSPFWNLIGMELVDVKKGWAKVRVPYAEKLSQPMEIAHGGAVFSPADSAVAMALVGLLEPHEGSTTVEMKINYLRPFSRGEITAEAKIVHRGNSTALGDVEVRNAQGALVAKGLATYMIIKNA